MPTTYAFPADRVARGLAIKAQYKNLGGSGTRYRPVRIAVIGCGEYNVTHTTDKRQVFTAQEVGQVYGYKSELYQAVKQLLPANGDGVGAIPVTVYPLAQPSGGVQADGDITPTGTATKAETYVVKINNLSALDVITEVGDAAGDVVDKIVAAINAITGMPVTATDGTTKVVLTAGWKGESGNKLRIQIVSPDDPDFTFVITQFHDGAGTVDVTTALALFGNVHESHIINCAGVDEDILNDFQTFGVGRRNPEVRKACTVYSGTYEPDVTVIGAITDDRKTDYVNVICPNPGSYDHPIAIASRWVARIAKMANENPAHDYAKLQLDTLTPGADSVQWTSAQRDYAVKAGCSTVEVIDGVVCISDTVTCYHPTGEEPPAYRYVCDIQKLDTVIYDVDLIFGSSEWAGAPLVPDAQAIKNPTAKKPKMAKAALSSLYDALALDALIADPDYSRANTFCDINNTNPKRLDIAMVVKLSGNTNVISVDLGFGFYFGGAQ